ncbi:MAG: efflux RND transporter periplasmic adaptor subunit [Verrucomicrobiales bacterium]|nr:efflux RND transporter periplasmic adaptor subunit [Verrucomicrobiales bacterium]
MKRIQSLLFVLLWTSCFSFSSAAEKEIKVLGYLEPYRSIEMNASEAGVIGKIHVSEGESVAEGQELLSLDNSVLEAQLAIAKVQAASEAAIIVADADLSVSKERYDKLYKLKRSGTAHSSEVSRAEADMKKAEGQVSIANEEKKIAEFRVQEIDAQIARRVLRSPIDGVVLEINREIAESATSPQEGVQNRPLVKVAQIDRLKLVIHVPSVYSLGLEVGKQLPVRILKQSSLSLDRGEAAVTTTGTIEFVSPAIDPSSETLRTRLVIDNREGKLQSGSHALVIFEDSPES